ncbi:MAG: phosphatidylcholine/phosphatidylserine synthase [Phycisphaerales bacterium]
MTAPDPHAADLGLSEDRLRRRRLRRERRRERLHAASIPLRRLVPNLFTMAALCCGLASLHFTQNSDFARAIAAIGMSALLDALDGRAARLLKVTSRFGEVFDSISDFVAFCAAPAFLLLKWCRPELTVGNVGLEGLLVFAAVVYAVCGAMRLARFTAMERAKKPGTKPSEFFTGLPTPAAAGAALIPPMLLLSPTIGARVPTLLVVLHLFMLAGLMISTLPMFSFKRLRVARVWVMPLMLLMALAVAGFVRDAWLTASLLAAAYLLTLPFSIRMRARPPSQGATAEHPSTGGDSSSGPSAPA